jgi:hypothetical protein
MVEGMERARRAGVDPSPTVATSYSPLCFGRRASDDGRAVLCTRRLLSRPNCARTFSGPLLVALRIHVRSSSATRIVMHCHSTHSRSHSWSERSSGGQVRIARHRCGAARRSRHATHTRSRPGDGFVPPVAFDDVAMRRTPPRRRSRRRFRDRPSATSNAARHVRGCLHPRGQVTPCHLLRLGVSAIGARRKR